MTRNRRRRRLPQVPDNLISQVVAARLWEHDCVTNGWVLDGFPANRSQADALAKAGFTPSRVYFLHVAPESLVERVTLRRVDPVTGATYHLLYAPPASSSVHGRLRQNPRDDEASVQKRIADFNAFEPELQDCYPAVRALAAGSGPTRGQGWWHRDHTSQPASLAR